MPDTEIDTARIDEAVLALMYLTLHRDERVGEVWRAWKTFDWDAMNRLHEGALILDPVGKAKSVVLTTEGRQRCEEAFLHLFVRRDAAQAASGS